MQYVDFSIRQYERLLDAALAGGYEFLTVRDYLLTDENELPERFVIMRHDVDRRAELSYAMANAEAVRGISATHYFRTYTFDGPEARRLVDMGHEVGYHYEDLSKTRGDVDAAHERFAENLEAFRAFVPVDTVCAHGSPLSPQHNASMWEDGPSLESYGLMGEGAYSIDTGRNSTDDLRYISDTGRDWNVEVDGWGTLHSTDGVAEMLEAGGHPHIYVLAHPGRWSHTRRGMAHRIAWDLAAESAKAAVKYPKTVIRTVTRQGGVPGLIPSSGSEESTPAEKPVAEPATAENVLVENAPVEDATESVDAESQTPSDPVTQTAD
ncbi:hypothetical protein AUR64_18670 [Haloprofundus marisrubri]|uniref:Polysaccharide deacetylase n=1 Tax=Haloprofundus marisrubri TaxID=1514971 RepID=A0A0W1R5F9_9EURY|nr:hypothetical protein [Haloprofundus marisrubri]KTG08689.1 hypothetical protein AUR64_18670 [Haloprofundus marisrubri]